MSGNLNIIFDPFEERRLTEEECSAIENELYTLKARYNISRLEDLVYHDMGETTNGKYEFIMSSMIDGRIFVTRYCPENEIMENPNQ